MNLVKQFQLSDLLALQKIQCNQEFCLFLKKKGVILDTTASLICQVYQFATIHDFNLQQKLHLINLTIKLLKQLPDAHTKQIFHDKLINQIKKMQKRDENGQCSFDLLSLKKIKILLAQKILPYYQLYEIVLDNNPHFELTAKLSEVVKKVEEKSLSSGSSVDVQNIDILKEFIGVRAPKEEKKDPKKK